VNPHSASAKEDERGVDDNKGEVKISDRENKELCQMSVV
jgi:hypothetical protein